MPLIESRSDAARSKNIGTEIRSGRSPKQAAAIAYSVQRKAAHAADGAVTDDSIPDNIGDVVGVSDNGLPLVQMPNGPQEIHPRGLDQGQTAQYASHLAASLPSTDDLGGEPTPDEQRDLASTEAQAGADQPGVADELALLHAEQPNAPADIDDSLSLLRAEQPEPEQGVDDTLALLRAEQPEPEQGVDDTLSLLRAEQGEPAQLVSNGAQGGGNLGMIRDFVLRSAGGAPPTQTVAPSPDADHPYQPPAGGVKGPDELSTEGADMAPVDIASPQAPAARTPTSSAAQAPAKAGGIDAMIDDGVSRMKLPPGTGELAKAIVRTESGGDNGAVSPTGVKGAWQYTKSTAEDGGFAPGGEPFDRTDPAAATDHALRDIAFLAKRYGNDPNLVYAAWNSGQSAVDAAVAKAKANGEPMSAAVKYVVHADAGGKPVDPQETQKAIPHFQSNLAAVRGQGAAAQSPKVQGQQPSQPQGWSDGAEAASAILSDPARIAAYGKANGLSQSDAVESLQNAKASASEPVEMKGDGANGGDFSDADMALKFANATGVPRPPPAPGGGVLGVARQFANPLSWGSPSGSPEQDASARGAASPAPPGAGAPRQAGAQAAGTPPSILPELEGSIRASTAPLDTAANEEERAQLGLGAALGARGAQQAQAARQFVADSGQQMGEGEAERNELVNRAKDTADSAQARLNAADAGWQRFKQMNVDPDRWWSSRSAGQKAMGLLGVIVSGFSGAQSNMGMQVLQKQIDRDIDAQKTNLDAASTYAKGEGGVAEGENNLLSHNMQFLQDERAARALTQSQLWDSYSAQLKQIEGTAATPIEAQKARLAAAQTAAAATQARQEAAARVLKNEQEMRDLAISTQRQQTTMGLLSGAGGSGGTNSAAMSMVYHNLGMGYVPGYGPVNKDAEKDAIEANTNYRAALGPLMQYRAILADPNSTMQARDAAAAMAKSSLGRYFESRSAASLPNGEKNAINSVVDPGWWRNVFGTGMAARRVQEGIDQLTVAHHGVMQSYGLGAGSPSGFAAR